MYLEENLKTIRDAQLDIELLRRDNEKKCMENNTKIEGLQDIIKFTEEGLESELKESGQKKLECKLGWCAYRVMPDKWDYDIPKLIMWAKENDLRCDKYVKVTEEFRKDQLKKDLLNDFLTKEETCDIGITITPQDPKFNYRLNGGL